jgi:hypothetical protein
MMKSIALSLIALPALAYGQVKELVSIPDLHTLETGALVKKIGRPETVTNNKEYGDWTIDGWPLTIRIERGVAVHVSVTVPDGKNEPSVSDIVKMFGLAHRQWKMGDFRMATAVMGVLDFTHSDGRKLTVKMVKGDKLGQFSLINFSFTGG